VQSIVKNLDFGSEIRFVRNTDNHEIFYKSVWLLNVWLDVKKGSNSFSKNNVLIILNFVKFEWVQVFSGLRLMKIITLSSA